MAGALLAPRAHPCRRRLHRRSHQFTGRVDIALSAREYALLETFMRRRQVLDRFQLLEHGRDDEYENRLNVIDVHVRYLGQKVDHPFGRESIETVRGAGHRLRADRGPRGA